ncbi:diacylglycerol kinase family protein [Bacillus sp. 03113]|uniref:diacylglycerol kinase family protein n=1 Tax=Bacillus sp. 03113 TaxID=2578211 RepID=UPI0011413AA3|nr:diacylglycerol kinase family protein [Bacillus sp. 03113]
MRYIGRVIRSFFFAITGIKDSFIQERNVKIHVVIALIVIGMGFKYSLSKMEWVFILIIITGMISLEMVNSAIERVVDLVTKDFHPLAKEAKDIAAGAVLIYAILAIIVGLVIFYPKIF